MTIDQKMVPSSWPGLAMLLLTEWRNTVTVLVFIMLLGWPAVVIKHWGAELGWWGSMHTLEHETQQTFHQTMSRGMETALERWVSQAQISKDILLNLEKHESGAAADRKMLSYFTWQRCVADNGKGAAICKHFETIIGETHRH